LIETAAPLTPPAAQAAELTTLSANPRKNRLNSALTAIELFLA